MFNVIFSYLLVVFSHLIQRCWLSPLAFDDFTWFPCSLQTSIQWYLLPIWYMRTKLLYLVGADSCSQSVLSMPLFLYYFLVVREICQLVAMKLLLCSILRLVLTYPICRLSWSTWVSVLVRVHGNWVEVERVYVVNVRVRELAFSLSSWNDLWLSTSRGEQLQDSVVIWKAILILLKRTILEKHI